MALNSAIAVYYYLKLIVYMFLREPSTSNRTVYMHNATAPFKFILGISAVASVFSIIFINDLMVGISSILRSSGF